MRGADALSPARERCGHTAPVTTAPTAERRTGKLHRACLGGNAPQPALAASCRCPVVCPPGGHAPITLALFQGAPAVGMGVDAVLAVRSKGRLLAEVLTVTWEEVGFSRAGQVCMRCLQLLQPTGKRRQVQKGTDPKGAQRPAFPAGPQWAPCCVSCYILWSTEPV